MRHVKRHSGFTLVELLVVLAIIIMISSISVPLVIRGGYFSANQTRAAAGDLYAQLRGAHVYATSNNVDTAIAYGVVTPYDSLYTGAFGVNVEVDATVVPLEYIERYDGTTLNVLDANFINDAILYDPKNAVLDSTLMVRRVRVDELKDLDQDSNANAISLAQAILDMDNLDEFVNYNDLLGDDIFVPLGGITAQFDPLPNGVCVLTNHPATDDTSDSFQATMGLTGIVILRIEQEDIDDDGDDDWVVTRVLRRSNTGLPIYGTVDLNTEWVNRFPAHVFSKKGGMDVNSTFQRLHISVGLFPDSDYFERFLVDEDTGVIELDANDDLISLDTDIELYVATGRVKVSGDV